MRILILVIHLIFCFFIQDLKGQERHLIAFELKDQFDNVYSDKDYSQEILIVIGSDKNGSKYNPIWSGAINDFIIGHLIADNINLIGVADLRGVPFFLKGFVKGKFPQNINESILLDWKGKLAKSYRFESDVSNILIFNKGNLVLKTYGTAMEDHKLQAVKEKLIELSSEEMRRQ